MQVAVGRREFLSVFGNDYKTDDGTGASWVEFGIPTPLAAPQALPSPCVSPQESGITSTSWIWPRATSLL